MAGRRVARGASLRARPLDGEPVAALLAVRGDLPAWLRRAVPEERLRTVEVDGLSVGAIHELLRARLDATFPRPTLIRLWETVAAATPSSRSSLQRAPAQRRHARARRRASDPLDLDELLQARLDGLGAEALEVAHVVAALADPTVALVEAAVGAGFDAGLAEALDARILELDGERLRFTHPLLGSAVAARETPARRRVAARPAREIVPTAEERARHLALATAEPDARGRRDPRGRSAVGARRGAPAAAAELAEQALRLTPAGDAGRRATALFVAADMHARAGDIDAGDGSARTGARRGAARRRARRRPRQLADIQARARERRWRSTARRSAEAEGDDALEATIHLSLAD